jgi:putative NADPH-quinone reductase
MRIAIILAHPSPGSLNHALAAAALEEARRQGHDARLRDLCAEGFDPVMPATELGRDAVLPPPVAEHCQEIEAADGIIIVHPNWWSAPPAILRGWVDRVLRPGRAYNFVSDGQGGARPVGLLRARIALVFNTANTPQEKEEALFGDPLETHWRKCVFGLCGVRSVRRWTFGPVITSTPDQRQNWIAEVQAGVAEAFGPAR